MTLLAQLNELERRRNENHLIGSRLAARLDLERVCPVDAQDEDVFTPAQSDEFARSVFPPMAAEMRAHPSFKEIPDLVKRLNSGEETLAAFRTLNNRKTGRVLADLEWLRVIDRPTADSVGRIRTGAWEVRNLRMAANIREVAARVPGGRVLVVVGHGHKAWLAAYLAMMTDVKIVDAEAVLK